MPLVVALLVQIPAVGFASGIGPVWIPAVEKLEKYAGHHRSAVFRIEIPES